MHKLVLVALIITFVCQRSDLAIAQSADAIVLGSSLKDLAVPSYPPEAIARSVQGDVVVRITIQADGRVLTSVVASGDPVLAEASRSAAELWRFGKTSQASSVPDEAEIVFRYVMSCDVVGLTLESKRLTVRVPCTILDPSVLDAGRIVGLFAENRPRPGFPRDVQPRNETAVLDIETRTNGQVMSVESDPGDRSFRSLAEQTLRGWTFREVRLNSQTVRLRGQIVVKWGVVN